MKNKHHGLNEKEMELVQLLMSECKTTSDIQDTLKRLFAGTIEQMLEAEMDEHLGYEKNLFSGIIPEIVVTATGKGQLSAITSNAK